MDIFLSNNFQLRFTSSTFHNLLGYNAVTLTNASNSSTKEDITNGITSINIVVVLPQVVLMLMVIPLILFLVLRQLFHLIVIFQERLQIQFIYRLILTILHQSQCELLQIQIMT